MHDYKWKVLHGKKGSHPEKVVLWGFPIDGTVRSNPPTLLQGRFCPALSPTSLRWVMTRNSLPFRWGLLEGFLPLIGE